VPSSPHIARYIEHIGSRLTEDIFLELTLLFTACYLGLLAWRGRFSERFTLIAVGVLGLIVFLGPILLSQDIFSYLAYARMAVEHGVNPYVHGPGAIATDPVYRYVGVDWKHSPTAYGPVFTIISYLAGPVGLYGGVWMLKALGLLSFYGLAAATAACAKRLRIDHTRAAIVVALNPLTILYTLGGAHNDLMMAALMMLGVWLALSEREGAGVGAIIAGAAVKATAAVVVPFLVIGTRRWSALIGTAVALLAFVAVSYFGFGVHALDFVAVLKRQQSFVSVDSFPTEVAHLFGKPGVYPIDRSLLRIGLILAVAYIAWRVWRGYDWISGSGWTLLLIAVSTTWLLAWYILWALPLAAIGRDRRLLVATLVVQALFLFHQMSPLLSPV
jgi:alpha-1,6-mannosyltransferase